MNRKKTIALIILIPGGIVPLTLFLFIRNILPDWDIVNLSLHTFLETTSFFGGIFLAYLMLLKGEKEDNNSHYRWISASLIAMSILDAFHAAINTENRLNTIALILGALIINLVWLPEKLSRSRAAGLIPYFIAVLAIVFGIIPLIFPGAIFLMLSGEKFIFTASLLNVIAGILFISATLYFLKRYWASTEKEDVLFSLFFILIGSSALLRPFGHTWSTEWWFVHFIRLTAYLVAVIYMFQFFQKSIERQRTEKILQEKEAKFRTLVNNIPQKIFLKDRDYHWVAVNKKLALDLGIEPEEVIGKLDTDLFPPDLAAKYHEDDVRIITTGATEEFVEKYIQDGNETWVQTIKAPVIDDKGDIIGVLGVFQDITEKKMNEDKLKQQEIELITKNRVAQVFLDTPDEDMYSEVLKVILEITESKTGIFGYIDEDGALLVPSLMKTAWWEESYFPVKSIRFPSNTWGSGAWAVSIREKKTHCSNESSSLMPIGNIPVYRHISVPVVFREKPIGLILIANRDSDYYSRDIKLLEEVANQIASSLMARLQRDIEEKRRREIETEMQSTVEILASSSSEIMTASSQIASGTAETSSAISETTTTVEEVRQAAQLSSEKARNVSDKAQRVDQVSQAGQKAVEDTAAIMSQIQEQMESIAQTILRLSDQTQSIGGIIASVTDIADQSNLLAVNAAIEAARAGDQGKGFAVVAQEIRLLAEQSKQATTQVRGILGDIQKATVTAVMATEQGSKSADAGVKQTDQTREAIRILVDSSREAAQTSMQIVASSQQQVVGMDQIGIAITNINQAGLETVASMRQVENSAKDLNSLGMKLKEIAGQFKG